jgi:proline iminopeptidase
LALLLATGFGYNCGMENVFINEKELFPVSAPFANGRLDRGLHQIYFEQCGRPDGKPVLFIHGGPGAGVSPAHRRLFNPDRYRVVLFDQRGCGKSLPHGEMAQNTTQDLIADIEALRIELGIERWLLFGGSWGSTLALAYAIAHPERVRGLILRGIFLGTRAEVDWFLHEMGRFFPEAYDSFVNILTPEERDDILMSYHEKLTDPQALVHQPAAERWSSYETSCSTLRAGIRRVTGQSALSMARLEAHYFVNDCFMPPNHIMNNIGVIKHLPAHIIQGRHDVICPPATAHHLAAAWGSNAILQIIDDAGHSTFENGIALALLSALDEFAI